jgi:hypothetical protein
MNRYYQNQLFADRRTSFSQRSLGKACNTMLESFRSLRKFFRRLIITDAPFEELSHHEGREGHEDRIAERDRI